MKKRNVFSVVLIVIAVILICCIIVLLLHKNTAESEQSSPETDTESETESGKNAGTPVLSDLFVSVSGSENLLIYSGSALSDSMSYPEFYVCEAGIIFYDANYSESEESMADFYIFDPQSGLITAQNSFNCEFLTDIRLTDKGLMFADSSLGYVLLLDEDLNISSEWTFEGNYEYWYISADGSGLYMIDEGTLSLINLESNTSSEVLSSSVSLYGTASINAGTNISYVDEDQLYNEIWLDLESGTLTAAPFEEALNTASLCGDIWLASLEDDYTGYIIGTEENAYYVSADEGTLSQVQNSDYILYTYDDNTLALYEADGSFVSSCTLSGDTLWLYSNFCAYSEAYGGFFILAYTDFGPELYFWDITIQSEGSDLSLTPLAEYEAVPGGSSADSSLYERAKAIGEEYGIEILIADQCAEEYSDFTAEQVSDYSLISEGLDIIEEALAAYPEGFIGQLKYNKITKIQINLMGELTPINSNWGEESYNGLTEESGNANVMVLDLNQLYTETVWHEFSHIIDKKLEWDSYCTSDALFSEDAWQALNPEGFKYEYVYDGFTELEFEGDEYLYFIDAYSMVSPTEDRARIMEYAMAGYYSYFSDYEPTAAKLAYYCDCIRDAFDTAGWPEVCAWEEPL